jgi:hypothetical protein
MNTKKALPVRKKPSGMAVRRQEKAYGDQTTICMNGGCALRKKAKCFGFEGCPGFKGR